MTWLRAMWVNAILAGVTVLALIELLATVALVLVPGIGLGMVFILPRGFELGRRWTNAWRRLIGRLTGVEIAVPYKPHPAPPVPEPDGLYRHNQTLHRGPRMPAFYARLDWVLTDGASGRDLLWLLLNPLVGGVLCLAGVVAPRPAVRLYGRWTRWLLGPARPAVRTCWAGLKSGTQATGRCFALVSLVPVGLVLLGLTALGLVLAFGLGLIFLGPAALGHFRWLANLRRQFAGWSGVEIPRPYQPLQPPLRRPDGMYQVRRQLFKTEHFARFSARWQWHLTDVASWRDLLWLAVDPVVTLALLLVPALGFLYGVWGLALPSLWASLFGAPHLDWYGAFAGRIWLAAPVGVALAAFSLAVAGRLLRVHARWTKVLLGPTKAAQLRLRVAQLTQTRTDAVDAQAAEVRRIERDLHDGAQARLVAVGLTLVTIEKLMETDPVAARALLAQARETSAVALAELRDLVRGIHPPVLSERGLGDAVRALALDTALTVDVAVDLPGRLAAPVESAAYFAVSELLANAARHAGAHEVRVDLRHRAGVLRITVTDDGTGGADPARGTGLRGIQRRLATFDGTLSLRSPAGGPTVATMEVPCASSSPRTSTSSATA